MSHFYGSMHSTMTKEKTCRGAKVSGISAHVRGWNIGVKIETTHENGRDIISIWQTSGSNDSTKIKLIKTIKSKEGKK